MLSWLSSIILLTSLFTVSTHAATFVDDWGVEHSWTATNPTVLLGAMDAITLFHFGISPNQIAGTFGERSASGSNYGGVYLDVNEVDHGDHANTPYDPSLFPHDPNEAERTFLNSLVDYSPTCSATNSYCSTVDIQALNDANGWPDLIIVGSFYSSLMTDEFRGNATLRGVPIVELLDAAQTDDGVILSLGMTQVIQRWEELAMALGIIQQQDSKVLRDKQDLCAAAATFTKAAQSAQDKGVRVMAGFLPYKPASSEGNIGAFLATPERDTVLAMMEELGMPLLHTDADVADAYEYHMTPDFQVGLMPFDNITSHVLKVPYWIDFWLYDDRVTLDFISESFAQSWPHVAVTQAQYAPFPSNARIYSYPHATDILTTAARPLADAERLNDKNTSCTQVFGGPAGESHRIAGLRPGEYACFEPITYSFCEGVVWTDGARGGDESGSAGAAAASTRLLLVVLVVVAMI